MHTYSESSKASGPAGSVRILVLVEDPDVRQVLRDLLECQGYELELVSTRKDLEQTPPAHYRAAIVDVALYDPSKLSLVKHLGTLACDVPMILLTGHDSDDARVRSLRLRHVVTMRKPYDAHALTSMLRNMLAETDERRIRRHAWTTFVPTW